ncbi:hypothetical protein BDN70DRAFT_902168 [Pholiota conissans]|uniref:Ribonuclease H1 N-terminal domain-containing protein n=1 Tax=Pholiota conissans TaxID=109636 RepID=A0A9P5YML1_9AGAR|nr:hypothetical protein BDN70DRAFT_902168 [Pholiota conissans]
MADSTPTDGSTSDEYFSADEDPAQENQDANDSEQATPGSVDNQNSENASRISPEEEVYWNNVDEFNFEDETLTSLLTSPSLASTRSIRTSPPLSDILTSPRYGISQNSPFNPPPSAPTLTGPSSEFHFDTFRPMEDYPFVNWHATRRYYVVTKGRAIGIFDNWLLTKYYIDGVNGTHQKAYSLRQAWIWYNTARELGHLQIVE